MNHNGDGEHNHGMDVLQRWTLIGILVAIAGAVLFRLGAERVLR